MFALRPVLYSLLVLILLLSPALSATPSNSWLTDYPEAARVWYESAAEKVASKAAKYKALDKGEARNIILFVGDGMGVSTITAARIFAGQQQGLSGEEYELAFDKFPFSGLSRTYNTDMQTPDSAGTITALITGVKTRAGVLSVNANVRRGDCLSHTGNALFSAVALAELAGLSTGVVSTARLTHATPAATYASVVDRNWEVDTFLSDAARQQGCKDIASQMVEFPSLLQKSVNDQARRHQKMLKSPVHIDGIDVMLGGGLRYFLPAQENRLSAGYTARGERGDGRNLLQEWQQKNPTGDLVFDRRGLDKTEAQKVFGLFSPSHMAYDAQRQQAIKSNGVEGLQPSLAEMTAKAIELLSRNKKGYLLVVEAGRIDHAHHTNNAYNALADTVALSKAVAVAVAQTQEADTLIIVTADHSHVFTMAGYPARGNPILGIVRTLSTTEEGETELALDVNGNPYTTLGYANGRGFSYAPGNTDADRRYSKPGKVGRQSLQKIDTTNSGYHQEALVGLESETHGGEDVAIYARGPGAYLVSGSHEQNVIFHVMNYAADLSARAQQALQ